MRYINIELYNTCFYKGIGVNKENTFFQINSEEVIELETFKLYKKKKIELIYLGEKIYNDEDKKRIGKINNYFKLNKRGKEKYIEYLNKLNQKNEGINNYNKGCPLDFNKNYLKIYKSAEDNWWYLRINKSEFIELSSMKIKNDNNVDYSNNIELTEINIKTKDDFIYILDYFTFKSKDIIYLEKIIKNVEKRDRKKKRKNIFLKIKNRIMRVDELLKINKLNLYTKNITIRINKVSSMSYSKSKIKVHSDGFEYVFEGSRLFFEEIRNKVFKEEKESL